MIFPFIVIWGCVILSLLMIHLMAAYSHPPVPARMTVTPSLMVIVIGAGLSGVVILLGGVP